jgi:uncharacterized cysteine cluster protein YcgN (CxxCxxCC family)
MSCFVNWNQKSVRHFPRGQAAFLISNSQGMWYRGFAAGAFGKGLSARSGRRLSMKSAPFWKQKSLREMTPEQWDALCDRCGLCCLEKLQDISGRKVYFTAVACRHLETSTCRCRIYANRFERNPHCTLLTPENVSELIWLPDTCAYRRLATGLPLMRWHPLVSGNPETVHTAGISVRNRVISARYVHPDDLAAYQIELNW